MANINKISKNIWIFQIFNIVSLVDHIVKTEKIYSLVTDLEPLLETQRNLINGLENIIERRKETLHFLEKELYRYKDEHKKVKEYPKINSISRFKVIQRMTVDFGIIKKVVKSSEDGLKNDQFLKYPTDEELSEAVSMISRLQRFYRLNITELADGIFNTTCSKDGRVYTEIFLPMTSNDCYEISAAISKSSDDKKYKLSLPWLVEAFRLYERDETVYGFKKIDVLQNICKGYDALGDHKMYVEWAKKFTSFNLQGQSKLESDIFSHKFQYHQTRLAKEQKTKTIKKWKKHVIIPKMEIENCLKGFERKNYRMLCRGKVNIAPEVSERLRCWYHFGHHPFTKLAPFRAEQLYIQPDVFLIHNVLTDAEMHTVIKIALPELEPITAVSGPRLMTSMVYHIAKGTELNRSQSQAISRRISDFTGFSTDSSSLLVSNCGVGGYYVSHVDGHGYPDRNKIMRKLNLTDADSEKVEKLYEFFKESHKMASVILYLSDVEQGGATVFPLLGLSVFPVKGAALFWSNLLPSGDLDYTTCHGACPLLRGSRWVGAMFVNYDNQTLSRPCRVKNTSRLIDHIPCPVISH